MSGESRSIIPEQNVEAAYQSGQARLQVTVMGRNCTIELAIGTIEDRRKNLGSGANCPE